MTHAAEDSSSQDGRSPALCLASGSPPKLSALGAVMGCSQISRSANRGADQSRKNQNHCDHSAGFWQHEGDLRCRDCDINQDNIDMLPRPDSLSGQLTRPAWSAAIAESIETGSDDLVKSCAAAINELDRVTPRPLTAEDQARAVLAYLANTKAEPQAQRNIL